MSPAKQAANAANAQLSTGPRTEEGKARSSRNATTHGLTSTQIVIPPGSEEAFNKLDQTLRLQIDPAEGLETITFNLLLRAAWTLERAGQIEATLEDPFSAEAEKVARYIARAERSYYRALKELRQLQTERTKLQNEPKFEVPATHRSPLETTQIGRNSACPCGSGAKYKRCCGKNAAPLLFMAQRANPLGRAAA